MPQGTIVVILLLVAQLLPGVARGVTPDILRADLESCYKPTIVDRLGFLKESGSVLIVRREGLRADRPGAFNRPNVIRGGEVAETGGGTLPLGGGLDGRLKVGERLRLYGVRADESGLELELATVSTFGVTGSRSPISLQALVRFDYDAGLASLTSRRVLDDVAAWLASENAVRSARTVRQGQSMEEVVSILGEPEKKVVLDAKTVFIYRDMKLIFREGRLADLE